MSLIGQFRWVCFSWMSFGSLCLSRNLSISSEVSNLLASSHLLSSCIISPFWMRALFCFLFLSPHFIPLYLVVSRVLSSQGRQLSKPTRSPMYHRCWDRFCPRIGGSSGHFSLSGQERLPGGGDAGTFWTISREKPQKGEVTWLTWGIQLYLSLGYQEGSGERGD